MKKKIIIDTNTLLAIYQFRIDIFSEIDRIIDFPYQLYVLDKIIEELKKTAEKKDKAAMAAKLALIMIQEKNIKTIKTEEGDVDSLILETAKKGYIVMTQDSELKKRLKKESIQVITIRKKQYLSFE